MTGHIYVSGPIANTLDARDRFTVAAAAITARGDHPVNPFDIPPHEHPGQPCPSTGYTPGDGHTTHASSCCYMRTDLAALLGCDAIRLLPGWDKSRGASLEHAVAQACGIRIEEP